MRIKYLKNEYLKPVILPERSEEEEAEIVKNILAMSDNFKNTDDGVFLEGGSFKSPNFVKKAKGWMLEENGKAWLQEIYVGNDTTYLSFDKVDGLKVKGNVVITNPGDIDGSTINNDSGWTDDTAADTAQAAAVAAQADATANDALLDDIAADSKITPVEKLTIKPLWDAIVAEKSDIDTQADTYSVSKVAYGDAYTTLDTYLNTTLDNPNGVFHSMATTTDITRATWDSAWEGYFNAKIEILQAIADAIQANAATAQADATTGITNAATAQTTAEGKAKVFRQDTAPVSGMVSGDSWLDTNDGDRPHNYNGSSWVETLTIIDGGKITTGTIDADVVSVINLDAASITTGEIVVGRTQAKCVNASADQTSVSNQGVSWLNEAVGSELPTANTAAKCTNASADQTSINTAADTAKVQGSILMTGGYIKADFITATNIITGTLTANATVGIIVNNGGDVIFNSSTYPTGSTFSQLIFNKTSVANKGWDIHFNATGGGGYQAGDLQFMPQSANDSDTVRLGMATQACNLTIHGNIVANGFYSIPSVTAYTYTVGTAPKPFTAMYATTYYFDRSGYAEKYIQMAADGSSIDVNTDFYVGGELSKSSGSFKIDHPLKPKTHWLKHSFTESPDMLNIYTGNAEIKNGKCKIKMPDWFIPLNGKNRKNYRYFLISIGQENNLWVEKEINNKGEVVFAGRKNGKFSYMITGIRHDKWAKKHRVQTEVRK